MRRPLRRNCLRVGGSVGASSEQEVLERLIRAEFLPIDGERATLPPDEWVAGVASRVARNSADIAAFLRSSATGQQRVLHEAIANHAGTFRRATPPDATAEAAWSAHAALAERGLVVQVGAADSAFSLAETYADRLQFAWAASLGAQAIQWAADPMSSPTIERRPVVVEWRREAKARNQIIPQFNMAKRTREDLFPLLEKWVNGPGPHVVEIVGSPGAGKSWIIAELRRRGSLGDALVVDELGDEDLQVGVARVVVLDGLDDVPPQLGRFTPESLIRHVGATRPNGIHVLYTVRPGECVDLHETERRRLLLGDVGPVADAFCERYQSQDRDIEFFVAHHVDQPRRRLFGESAVIVRWSDGSFEAARAMVERLSERGALVHPLDPSVPTGFTERLAHYAREALRCCPEVSLASEVLSLICVAKGDGLDTRLLAELLATSEASVATALVWLRPLLRGSEEQGWRPFHGDLRLVHTTGTGEVTVAAPAEMATNTLWANRLLRDAALLPRTGDHNYLLRFGMFHAVDAAVGSGDGDDLEAVNRFIDVGWWLDDHIDLVGVGRMIDALVTVSDSGLVTDAAVLIGFLGELRYAGFVELSRSDRARRLVDHAVRADNRALANRGRRRIEELGVLTWCLESATPSDSPEEAGRDLYAYERGADTFQTEGVIPIATGPAIELTSSTSPNGQFTAEADGPDSVRVSDSSTGVAICRLQLEGVDDGLEPAATRWATSQEWRSKQQRWVEDLRRSTEELQMRMGSAEFELVAVDAAGIPISKEKRLDSEITDFFRQEAERARQASWVPPLSAWSSDSRQIATANHRGIGVWSVDDGILEVAVAGPSSAVTALAWSPDGKRLAAITVSTSDEYEVWPDDRYGLAWSSDGTRLAASYHGRRDWGTTETTVWDLTTNGAPHRAPIRLGELSVLDLGTGATAQFKGDPYDAIVAASFLPDDPTRIVAELRRGGTLRFHLVGSSS